MRFLSLFSGIESRIMPLYTEEALLAFRQKALDDVMARIPANLPHDKPYRPVNLGWSQCCEYMRGAVDDLMEKNNGRC